MIFNGTRVNACTQVQEKLSSTPEPADLKFSLRGFFHIFPEKSSSSNRREGEMNREIFIYEKQTYVLFRTILLGRERKSSPVLRPKRIRIDGVPASQVCLCLDECL